MTSRGRPHRPTAPPENKQRSFSDQSGYEANADDSFEYRNFKTLPNAGIERNVINSSRGSPPPSKFLEENTRALTRQAPPPRDWVVELNLSPVAPQTFHVEDAPVFFTCSSLPGNPSHRGSSTSSDASEPSFKYFRQTSTVQPSTSISGRSEDTEFRRYSAVMIAGSEAVTDYLTSLPLSMRIGPSPELTLDLSNEKDFDSDLDLLEPMSRRGILGSDPDDESDARKSCKGRGMRLSMLMLSKSLENLHSPDDTASRASPEKRKKVDIEKLNRFFGESKETATDLEANIYHLLISGNQLKESLPGAAYSNSRAKKSASTWFLSSKALDSSLPVKPLDADLVPKTRKSAADELSTLKLKGGFTEKGKQFMRSFKRRVVAAANLTEGLTPADVRGTFDIPIEECVMSPTNKLVPLLVERCVRVIEEIGLEAEGVYRLSGNGLTIAELQEELDRDPAAVYEDSERWKEVHIVTNILKLFFRKLPDSLITDEFYTSVIQLSGIAHQEKRLLKLKVLLERLSKVNFETFKFLSGHLHKVSSFWNVNKMDAHNLAIMFGPTLIRSPKDQTLAMIKDMHYQTAIVEMIINHSDWLFSGWSEDLSIPTDEVTMDAGINSTANLQLLESAETLVARQLRVVPVEEKSSFFSFQGPLRRSRRRHRNKSGKDESNEAEQKTVPHVEQEIELHRIEIPALPFKIVDSLRLDRDHYRTTSFADRSKRAASDRLDAKTLDVRLVSTKLEDSLLRRKGDESAKTDPDGNFTPNADCKGAAADTAAFEIKKFRAYDADVRAATLAKHNVVQQPTLLKKYPSKPNLGVDSGSLKKSPANSLKKYSGPNLAQIEKENQRSVHSSQYKQRNAVGYHPDVSQLPLDCTSENAYWENGSLKKTNIVVRGPLGRRYCVLSGTDPSVLLNGVPPTSKPLRVVEYLDKRRCTMTCVINLNLSVVQEAGSHDVQLRRIQYA